MKRVETREATTSRGAEGVGPAPPLEPGIRWSVVARVSEVGGGEGMATSLSADSGVV